MDEYIASDIGGDPSALWATIFCSIAISASGAVTFGEWLASIAIAPVGGVV